MDGRGTVKRLFTRLRAETRGNVLLLGAVGCVTMVGGAGLGVDTVQWYLWKRQLQQVVDAGALAGAHDMAQGLRTPVSAAREIDRNANVAIAVERIGAPPASGAFAGNPKAVEVIATTSRRLPFASMFLNAAPVLRARAVAAPVNDGEYCIVSLARTGIGIDVSGSADIRLGCGVSTNSGSATAINLDGSSFLQANPLNSVGGIQAAPSSLASNTVRRSFGSPQADPLAGRNLSVPAEPSACTANALQTQPNNSTTLSPGRYCNGMALKGNVTLRPGVYIVDGGTFDVASQAQVSGEGVTIILTGRDRNDIAHASISGGASLHLTAPTAADDPVWQGILLYQDPRGSAHDNQLAGGSSMDLQGVIYMPGGDLDFVGGSGQHADCLLIVASRVSLNGTAALDNDCPADYSGFDFAASTIKVVE